MITIDETPRLKTGGKYEFSFKGLSTDAKPTETHMDLPIANGSSFMEIDTKELKYYDEAGKSWV